MSVLGKLAGAIKKGLSSWNPALHPRGRDGRFIEVGDQVRVFSGPGGPQIATGTVVAGHLGSDGRMWIGIKGVNGVGTGWYRPKQIEEINPKATMTAAKTPLPLADGMPEDMDVGWDETDAYASQVHAADITSTASLGAAKMKSAIPDTYDVANAAIAAAHGHAGELAIDPDKGLLVTPEIEAFIADIPALSKGPDGRMQIEITDPAAVLNIANSMIASEDPVYQTVGAEMARLISNQMTDSVDVEQWEAEWAAENSEGDLNLDPNSPTYAADLAALESILEPEEMAEVMAAQPPAQTQTDAGKKVAMIVTSATNKGLPGGVLSLVADSINDALYNPNESQSTKSLNAAMTAAKLGGKQRKRYKELLAEHRAAIGLGAGEGAGPAFISPAPAPGYPLPAIGYIRPSPPPPVNIPTQGTADGIVNDPAISPGDAKRNIQMALADRLQGKVTPQQVRGFVGHAALTPGAGYIYRGYEGTWSKGNNNPNTAVPATQENVDRANLENMVRALIAEWAGSSNSGPRAQAMQDIAGDIFGIPPEWKAGWHFKADGYNGAMAHRPVLEAFLREMYDHTQQTFKAKGITHIKLMRGVNKATDRPDGSPTTSLGLSAGKDYGPVKTRPLSSFASNLPATHAFGNFKMQAFVPIERIIGSALTGFGCKNEYEFVVLGGPGEYELWRK